MSELETLISLSDVMPPGNGSPSACLAQSLDSVLDEACAKLHTFSTADLPSDVQQVLSLLEAASSLADQLLDSLGVHDPDQDGPAAQYSAGALTSEVLELAATPRTYSDPLRKKYASQGVAMPDGSFPIPDRTALRDAIDDFGRDGSKPAVKAHILKRAKALGAEDMIPPNWK